VELSPSSVIALVRVHAPVLFLLPRVLVVYYDMNSTLLRNFTFVMFLITYSCITPRNFVITQDWTNIYFSVLLHSNAKLLWKKTKHLSYAGFEYAYFYINWMDKNSTV
ncbi:hypothetical protein ACJX0J_023996, partial [Zea mays]